LNIPSVNKFRRFDGASIESDDIAIVNRLLKDPKNILEDHPIQKMEDEFKRQAGTTYATSFSHGRVALTAILKSLGLKSGSEIILPAYTCVVVPNSIIFEDLTPVYCDIELETFSLDIDKLKGLVTSRTGAIIVQHLYGFVARDYEAIINLCRDNNIYLIDDSAQSFGATYRGKMLGNYSTAAIFSMQHSKILSVGNGGVAISNDDEIGESLISCQKSAIDLHPDYVYSNLIRIKELYYANSPIMGRLYYKYNRFRKIEHQINIDQNEQNGIVPNNYYGKLSAQLAQLALNQLSKVATLNQKRIKQGQKWRNWCISNGLFTPTIEKNSEPVFLRVPLLIPSSKKDIVAVLRKNPKYGDWFDEYISSASANRQLKQENFPNATMAINSIINLPTL
jgi:perosamine synthetase